MLALAAAAAMVTALVGASPAIASAAAHSALRAGAPAAAGAGLTLGQAPAGLRAAVRGALGATATGSAFQKATLAAADGAANDHFGWSVAISGSTAVVGAYGHKSSRGAVYVFVNAGTKWSLQAELADPGATAGDQFGHSVAISGSTVVAGAPGRKSSAGAAYIYARSGATWTRQASLADPAHTAGDHFGTAVAIYGTTVLAGADGTSASTGAAYVYVRSGTTWSKQARLTSPTGVAGDLFGAAVAVSAVNAIVGASGANSGTGQAWAFSRSGTGWSREAKLTAPDGAAGDGFGSALALSGPTLVIGAGGHSSGSGAAYVYTASGESWPQQAELTATGGAAGDGFGSSVATTGSVVLVGANGASSSTGAAYAFTRQGVAWNQQAELTGKSGAHSDLFGRSVAISGSTALAGAPGRTSNTGAAYVFLLPSQQANITDPGTTAGDAFGNSVAVSGSNVVVGAPNTFNTYGETYMYGRAGTTWTQHGAFLDPQASVNDLFGTSVAISGSTAVIGAPGPGGTGTGVAYVFTLSGGTWSQQAKLGAADVGDADNFGQMVAISGSTAVTNDPFNMNNVSAYIFAGPSWNQQAEFTGGDSGGPLGSSVAVSGSTALVTDGEVTNVYVRSGTTWSQQATLPVAAGALAISGSTAVVGTDVFVRSGTTWSQQATLPVSGSVAISGSTVVVGAGGSNAVYVFTRSGTTWSQQAVLTPADTAASDFGGSVSISGSTVVVGADATSASAGAAYVFVNV